MKHPQNEIVFPAGTRVRVKKDYQNNDPMRLMILIVRHHTQGDVAITGDTPFIDNCLYTKAYQFVGPFANWEIEKVEGEA